MSAPELGPRAALPSIVSVWAVALVVSVAIGILVPVDWRMAWMTIGLGGCIVLAFVVQLWAGRSVGFIDRVALSAVGALLVMGIVSAIVGLVTIVPGMGVAG